MFESGHIYYNVIGSVHRTHTHTDTQIPRLFLIQRRSSAHDGYCFWTSCFFVQKHIYLDMAIYFLPMFEPTNGFCWVVSISSVIDYSFLPQNEYNFFFSSFYFVGISFPAVWSHAYNYISSQKIHCLMKK